MSDNYSRGFSCGVKIACQMYGVSEADCHAVNASHKSVAKSKDTQDAICKIASSIFHAAGDHESAALYDGLLASGHLIKSSTARSILLDSVLQALADNAAEEEMSKSSSISSMIGGGVSLMPDFLKGTAGLSLLVGGGLGAGWWALNRDANSASEVTAIKEEQAKYYRELAKKIRDKAGKTKKQKLSKKEIEKIVEETTPANSSPEEVDNINAIAEALAKTTSIYG